MQLACNAAPDLFAFEHEVARQRAQLLLRQPQPLLGAPQLKVGLPSFGYVADGGGDQHTTLRLERTKTDLYRELGSVTPQAPQFHGWPGRPALRLQVEIATSKGVAAEEAFGNQRLDGFALQFLAGISKHLFGFRIHQNDYTGPVQNQDRVGSLFQQPAELLFTGA